MKGKAEDWGSHCSVCTLLPRPSPPPSQIGEKEGEPKETQGIYGKDVETLMPVPKGVWSFTSGLLSFASWLLSRGSSFFSSVTFILSLACRFSHLASCHLYLATCSLSFASWLLPFPACGKLPLTVAMLPSYLISPPPFLPPSPMPTTQYPSATLASRSWICWWRGSIPTNRCPTLRLLFARHGPHGAESLEAATADALD